MIESQYSFKLLLCDSYSIADDSESESERGSPWKLACFHFIIIVKGLAALDRNGVTDPEQIGPV
jgi:hypothetical protein